MKTIQSTAIALLALLFSTNTICAENLVVITLDGLRWQEVFSGYDEPLLKNSSITKNSEALKKSFGGETPLEKRKKLMPFFWSTVQQQGVLVGNRSKGSTVNLTNNWWFSYPGYNEILTGKADSEIKSNESINNRNKTFLEWLNKLPEFSGRVAAFGSWDAFPYIINRDRSGVFVNAGFENANWENLSEHAQILNQLQNQTPTPWETVRFDAFTYGFAKEYLLQQKPRVLYIALGETDDFAHDKQYHQYLQAAHRSDQFIADLWQTLQSIASYRNNTNLIITVDHGRGNDAKFWPHHGSAQAVKQHSESPEAANTGITGSNEIWFAALGPDIKNIGEASKGEMLYQNQVAATALKLLGKNPADFSADANIGPAIDGILR